MGLKNRVSIKGMRLSTKLLILIILVLVFGSVITVIPEILIIQKNTDEDIREMTKFEIDNQINELDRELEISYSLWESMNENLSNDASVSELISIFNKMNSDNQDYYWIHKIEKGKPIALSHPSINTNSKLTDSEYNVAIEFKPETDSLLGLVNETDYKTAVENKSAENVFLLASEILEEKDIAYILYYFNKPGTNELMPKLSAVRKLDSEDFEEDNMYIGTGVYLDDIVAQLMSYEKKFQADHRNNIYISLISTGVKSIIIVLVIFLFSNIAIRKPLEEILQVLSEAGNGKYKRRIEVKNNDEFSLIADNINKLMDYLVKNIKLKEQHDKQQASQMKINRIIEENKNLEVLAKAIISILTKDVNGQIGAIYLRKTDTVSKQGGESIFQLYASYAYTNRKNIEASYKPGQGLIGQSVIEKELIVLENVPEDYISINSGLGKTPPKNLVILPCIYNDAVICVIEIGFIEQIDPLVIELLGEIQSSIAISIESLQNIEDRKILLEETLKQSKELENQQEELRASNEELEEQTEMLKKSQAMLETQQEELEVTNEELESKSELMKKAKDELKKNNDALEKAREIIQQKVEDLEMSNKYKSEFLANMSHELRTPLNSILILSELLHNNKKNNLSMKEVKFAETINSSGQDLLNLINNILDLSKVEAGKTEVEISEFKVEDFIDDMKRTFEPSAIKESIEFRIEKSERLPEIIMTDEQKLKQITRNLLSNAFKFTEKGTITMRVDVMNSMLRVQVIDTGVGIDEKQLNHVFEAFQQEDGSISRKFGGTGLGLSISKEFAKLLKGDLTVESKKGDGSTFTLKLPIHYKTNEVKNKIDAKVEEISKKTRQDVLKENMSKTERIFDKAEDVEYIPDDRNALSEYEKGILIVEDDINFAEVLLNLVREDNHKAIVAETGETALYYADYYLPSGIILDIGLPGIDGYEVVNRLKDNERTKDIPIYMISGREQEDRQELESITKYFNKPVAANEIEEIIESIEKESFKDKKIIIVEDNNNHRNSTIELIKDSHENVMIDAFASGKEALKSLITKAYDLIIIDLGLGDITGEEIIHALKKNELNKNISIVVYTGEDIPKKREIALRKEVDDIIIKGDEADKRLLDEVKIFLNKVNTKEPIHDNQSFKSKKVLVVDDDMRNIFALSSILENHGIEVEIATDGQEGINKLKEVTNIDLVLMDIMMPVMNGYDAIREIREINEFKNISIIALTAKAMKGDRNKCIEIGADEYLAKPIDSKKLLSLLRVWL